MQLTKKRPLFVCLFAVLFSGLVFCGQVFALPLIAAASDLKFALEEIARIYRAETGKEVRLVFGSSGNFASQIAQGAPFQIFMSADEALVKKVQSAGKSVGEPVIYGLGRLVLFVPKGVSPGLAIQTDESLRGLEEALKDGRIKKLAIANPEHAPYGDRARQALKHRGLWELVLPKLVLGENVSQAASFASLGSAQAALIAYSLVLAEPLASQGRSVLIPESWHQPLLQSMTLLKSADAASKDFFAYLQQARARTVLEKFGFRAPK